jgi:hypothetical protein
MLPEHSSLGVLQQFRNTLLFVAADEAQLGTAREAMRRARAWETIGGDPRHNDRVDRRAQEQMTQVQLAEARDKAKNSQDGAMRAVRMAWSHVLFSVESSEPGKAFDLDHLMLTTRDRSQIPDSVYDKASAKGDGIIKEALGGETLATRLIELWPADRPHLPVTEIAEWFATYVYLPKLRDRVVLEAAIRDALAKLDPKFGYADSFDEAGGKYIGLLWQKAPSLGPMAQTALLVQPAAALAQLRAVAPTPQPVPGTIPSSAGEPIPFSPSGPEPAVNKRPRRFFGRLRSTWCARLRHSRRSSTRSSWNCSAPLIA